MCCFHNAIYHRALTLQLTRAQGGEGKASWETPDHWIDTVCTNTSWSMRPDQEFISGESSGVIWSQKAVGFLCLTLHRNVKLNKISDPARCKKQHKGIDYGGARRLAIHHGNWVTPQLGQRSVWLISQLASSNAANFNQDEAPSCQYGQLVKRQRLVCVLGLEISLCKELALQSTGPLSE